MFGWFASCAIARGLVVVGGHRYVLLFCSRRHVVVVVVVMVMVVVVGVMWSRPVISRWHVVKKAN
jgi:hypothetical protein